MIIHIKDQTLQLKPEEVASAKKIVSRFIKTVQTSSENCDQWSFYLTTLIIMHIMSQSLLDQVDPDTFLEIFPKKK